MSSSPRKAFTLAHIHPATPNPFPLLTTSSAPFFKSSISNSFTRSAPSPSNTTLRPRGAVGSCEIVARQRGDDGKGRGKVSVTEGVGVGVGMVTWTGIDSVPWGKA
jgi:hypothetical protein